MCTKAQADQEAAPQSRASRRKRLSQAMPRSIAHRRGRSLKPFYPGARATISSVASRLSFALAVSLPR